MYARARIALLALAASACQVTESNIYNLAQLHENDSKHRYQAALESDIEYVLRHQVAGLFRGAGASLAQKSPSKLEDPPADCLENLIELEHYTGTSARLRAQQIEWFARLSIEDPWKLSRERAVIGLGHVGVKIGAGMPARLGTDQHSAGPDELAPALEQLIDAVRQLRESRPGAAERLAEVCDSIQKLEIDLDAGRRALRAVTELASISGSKAAEPLQTLSAHLQRVCVRRALGRALDDPEPRVRIAALGAVAECGGAEALDVVFFERLRTEREGEVVIAMLHILSARGLPDAGAPRLRSREDWLSALYQLLPSRPESDVRVAAMRALGALSGSGLRSLREEDWQAWWYARGAPPSTNQGSGS
jgi:hypothetical protein